MKFSNTMTKQLGHLWRVNYEISQSGLFIGSKYDITHNFYYQISGIKRVIISFPSEIDKLNSYPFGHENFKFSRIPHKYYFIKHNKWKIHNDYPYNLYDNIKSYKVTLYPGDLLYLPPFYFIQQTTMENSIQLHSWTLGYEELLHSLSNVKALPDELQTRIENNTDNFESKQTNKVFHLAYFTRKLIDYIIKILPDNRDSIDNPKLLSIYNEKMEFNLINDWIQKFILNIKYKGNMWDKLNCNTFNPIKCGIQGNSTETIMENMHRIAKTWGYAYKQMKFYVNDKNDLYYIRNIMLSNHIEQFIGYIVGETNICNFLQCIIADRYSILKIPDDEEKLQQKLQQQRNYS